MRHFITRSTRFGVAMQKSRSFTILSEFSCGRCIVEGRDHDLLFCATKRFALVIFRLLRIVQMPPLVDSIYDYIYSGGTTRRVTRCTARAQQIWWWRMRLCRNVDTMAHQRTKEDPRGAKPGTQAVHHTPAKSSKSTFNVNIPERTVFTLAICIWPIMHLYSRYTFHWRVKYINAKFRYTLYLF